MNNINQPIPQRWAVKYYTIFAGQAVSLFGSGLVQFALVWHLTQKTGSATVLAMATLVAMLPQVILGPLVGALVDRWNRRMIMIVADAGIAASTAVLVYLFYTGQIEVWHIYLVMFVRSIGDVFHHSALGASTVLLVPSDQLTRVSGINQTLRAAINIVSPPTGALLLGIMPMQSVLFIDIVTALFGVLPLLFLSIPQPVRELTEEGKHKTSVWEDMKEGIQYIRSWPGLMAVIALALACNFLLTPTGSLMPLLVTKHFGLGALEFGLMDSIWAFGMVIGGILLSVWGGFKKNIITAMVGIIGIGVGITIVGFAPANMFWLAVVGMTISGITNPIVNGPLGAILQASVKPEMQGRVMGVVMSLATIITPLSLAFAGPVSDVIGIRTWYWVAGIATLLMGIGGFFTPIIMNVEQNRNESSPPLPLQASTD